MTTTETERPSDAPRFREFSSEEIAAKRFRPVWRRWDALEAKAFLGDLAASYTKLLDEVHEFRNVHNEVETLQEKLRLQELWLQSLISRMQSDAAASRLLGSSGSRSSFSIGLRA